MSKVPQEVPALSASAQMFLDLFARVFRVINAGPRPAMGLLHVVVVAIALGTAPAKVDASEPVAPLGFELEEPFGPDLVTELSGALMQMIFLPDGRFLAVMGRGEILIFDADYNLIGTYLDITDEVFTCWHRGLVSAAINPDWDSDPWIYMAYPVDTRNPPWGLANADEDTCETASFVRLTRYKPDATDPNIIDESTRDVLIGEEWSDGIPAPARSHSSATLRWARDGTLIMGVGDTAHFNGVDAGGRHAEQFGPGRSDPAEDIGAFRSQTIHSLAGKILRMDAEGNGLPSNPYWDGNPKSSASRVWLYGFRNPWRNSIIPGTGSLDPADGDPGTLVIGDVGWSSYEELIIAPAVDAGRNYGWPCMEGPLPAPGYPEAPQPPGAGCDSYGSPANPSFPKLANAWLAHDDPNLSFPVGFSGEMGNTAILGGAMYTGLEYPPAYRGAIFVGDYSRDKLRVLTVDSSFEVLTGFDFAGINAPTFIEPDPLNGDLWVGSRLDNTIYRIRYTGGHVVAESPTQYITTTNECVTVPISLTRTDSIPVLGYRVTFTMSPELEFCDDLQTSVRPGELIPDGGGTHFIDRHDNGDGTYTIEQALLNTCGATGDGSLFTVDVRSNSTEGLGVVTVTDISLRDCQNGIIPAEPWETGVVNIDKAPPASIQDLSAGQVTSGNDRDGTIKVTVSYTGVEEANTVEVYRKGHGEYPSFGQSTGMELPASPTEAANQVWFLTPVLNSGESDETPVRDWYYYVAYVIDEHGNVSPPSNMTSGLLNYYLPDISDGTTRCQGDNIVDTSDLSYLGIFYGVCTIQDVGCVDFSPTEDYTATGRPTPDGCIDFQELILSSISFWEANKQLKPAPAPAVRNQLSIQSIRESKEGDFVDVDLWLQARGDIQGLSVELQWDADVVRPQEFQAGDLWQGQPGMNLMLSPQPGTVDGALFGLRDIALSGEGVWATVRFARVSGGDPKIGVGKIDARGRNNQLVEVGGQFDTGRPQRLPRFSELHPPVPNPFNPRTTIRFTLAQPGDVQLRIYAPNGRLVRTLVDESRGQGSHVVEWDGGDNQGRQVSSGSYLVRLQAPDRSQSRSVLLLK